MKDKVPIHQCEVFWHVPIQGEDAVRHHVGTLARDGAGHLYFAYAADWLPHGIEISPSYLPLLLDATPVSLTDPASSGYEPDATIRSEFRGLPGPFYDSLPDKWGMKLIANHTGKETDAMDALEILCHRGNRCMGAFSYEPATATTSKPGNVSSETLDLYCQHAAQVSAGIEPESLETTILDALEDSGGSAGGMRPKMLLAIRTGDLSGTHSAAALTLRKLAGYDHSDMSPDFEPWLLKFDTEPDQCRGLIEQAYAEMAREAGVLMPRTTLIRTHAKNGTLHTHFAIQRFDRELINATKNESGSPRWHRIHMHTAAGILRRDFNQLDLDYTDLLELTKILTGSPEQVRQTYVRAIFNILAGNSDDHAKNHAFLLDQRGAWKISPAYDLTPSRLQQQPGIRSTSVLGNNSERIPLSTLLHLADEHEISDAMGIIQQVAYATRRWSDHARAVKLPQAIAARYASRIDSICPKKLSSKP